MSLPVDHANLKSSKALKYKTKAAIFFAVFPLHSSHTDAVIPASILIELVSHLTWHNCWLQCQKVFGHTQRYSGLLQLWYYYSSNYWENVHESLRITCEKSRLKNLWTLNVLQGSQYNNSALYYTYAVWLSLPKFSWKLWVDITLAQDPNLLNEVE